MSADKKINVLFITPVYWPNISFGGPVVSVKLLAESLKELGANVFIFTTAFGLEKNKSEEKIVDDIKVNYFKYFKFRRWIISLNLIKNLWQLKNNFDIFHINLVWEPVAIMSGLILVLFKKKIVISPRGAVEDELIKKRSFWLKKIVYFLFIKFIFKKASGFHFTSQKEKEEFFKFTKIKKPYVIISNLFDYDEFKKEVDKNLLNKFNLKDKKYILYFGRINWKKQLELLIDAFYEINKNFKDVYLALIGSADKDYFEKLKQKIKDLNSEDKIILVGETVFGGLKIALYQNACCFVLPSISENFGYVVVEALASKIPVIISEGVGLKELIEKYNAGLVFSGENYEKLKNDLADKLKLVLENKNLTNELVENGDMLLQKEFNNQDLAQKMLEFYYQIL